jgi:predicted metal-dependent HD superfamily phosphohydrolase
VHAALALPLGQDELVDVLLQPWVGVLGSEPAAVRAGEELLERYAESHRGYHDRLHLAEVLQALRTLCSPAPPPGPVICAAYWHDAVYDPTRSDNERRSAALAEQVLAELGLPQADVEEVVRLVLLTQSHAPAEDDEPGALLCDADLAVLAAPPSRYRDYVAGVRHEYSHLDDDAFRRGRAGVLRQLVERRRLFTTAPGSRRWDVPARANLRDELARLGAALPP